MLNVFTTNVSIATFACVAQAIEAMVSPADMNVCNFERSSSFSMSFRSVLQIHVWKMPPSALNQQPVSTIRFCRTTSVHAETDLLAMVFSKLWSAPLRIDRKFYVHTVAQKRWPDPKNNFSLSTKDRAFWKSPWQRPERQPVKITESSMCHVIPNASFSGRDEMNDAFF